MTQATTSAPLRRRSWRARFFGALRVFAFALVAFLVLAGLALRSVWADATEATLAIGRELSGLRDLLGAPYRVRLNGEAVQVGSAMTEASVGEVLDRVEAACRAGSVGLGEAIAEAAGEPRPKQADALGLGIVRKQAGDEGMVACLARADAPGAPRGLADLVARLRRFAATGDLAEVGHLRYAYARRGATRTHVVTAWTDGPLNVARIAPPRGEDAPGGDSPMAPRPEGARRVLVAQIDGAPYGVRLYESPRAPDAALAAVERDALAHGWAPAPATADAIPSGRAFTRDGSDLLAFAYERPGGSVVTYVEMPR